MIASRSNNEQILSLRGCIHNLGSIYVWHSVIWSRDSLTCTEFFSLSLYEVTYSFSASLRPSAGNICSFFPTYYPCMWLILKYINKHNDGQLRLGIFIRSTCFDIKPSTVSSWWFYYLSNLAHTSEWTVSGLMGKLYASRCDCQYQCWSTLRSRHFKVLADMRTWKRSWKQGTNWNGS